MTKAAAAKRRRAPRQERARELFDAVLDAAAKEMVKSGYEHASTNRIAARAGVSIGSLYQYFEGKEAIVAALIDRHTAETKAVCHEALMRAATLPLDRAVRETVAAIVAAHAIEPKLHKVLHEQVPRVGKLRKIDQMHEETAAMVHAQLRLRPDQVTVQDPELAATLVVRMVDALIHSSVDMISEKWPKERVIDEIVAIVMRYLTGK